MTIISEMTHEDVMKYCAGVADGDGCIHASPPSTLKFSISQATPGKKVIDYFGTVFAGGLITHRKRDIKWDEQWEITYNGSKAVQVCREIAPFSTIKKYQFEEAAKWDAFHRRVKVTSSDSTFQQFPSVAACERAMGVGSDKIAAYLRGSKNLPRKLRKYEISYVDPKRSMEDLITRRCEIAEYLETAKTIEHQAIEGPLSIAYAAGFLDAEGHFEVTSKNAMKVSAKQKYRAICDAFASSFGGYVTKFEKDENTLYYQWSLNKGAKLFLIQACDFLISTKREQADLLINMPKDFGPIIKLELAKLSGLQKGSGGGKLRELED